MDKWGALGNGLAQYTSLVTAAGPLAAQTADEMLDQGRRDRAQAAATLERARTEAAELVRVAVTERDRLTGEAAEAGADDIHAAFMRLTGAADNGTSAP